LLILPLKIRHKNEKISKILGSVIHIWFHHLPINADKSNCYENEAVRSHFPTAFATDISQLCYNDSQLYLKAYFNKEKWAFKSKPLLI